jgi:hypothetical protein
VFWAAVALWTALAIVADYVSLWKTRILLTRSGLLGNALTAAIVVVADVFGTLVITLVFYCGTLFAGYLFGAANLQDVVRTATQTALIAFSWPHIEDSARGLTRLAYLAPLLTSAWLWAYLLVAYAMRAASYLPSWLRPLSKVMDFESHPVRTIGYVAAAVSALIVGISTLA